MTNDDRSPLAERVGRPTHKAPAKLACRLRAAKTIVMMQIRADEAKFRKRQADNVHAILEAVLKRKAELATLDRDNDE